jgi:predicted metal-dependent phosphoesterase TrpH
MCGRMARARGRGHWIRAAGGVASLAHPARYSLSAGARRQLLGDFVAAGGAALEVVTGGNGAQHVEACRRSR